MGAETTATLRVYKGRDNEAKFEVVRRSGVPEDLSGASRVTCTFGGSTFDSATLPSKVSIGASRTVGAATYYAVTLQLGNTAAVLAMADGRYTDGRVVIYDAARPNGFEAATRLVVIVQ